jgi:hypothetical protein
MPQWRDAVHGQVIGLAPSLGERILPEESTDCGEIAAEADLVVAALGEDVGATLVLLGFLGAQRVVFFFLDEAFPEETPALE